MRTEDGYIIRKCLDGESEAFGFLIDKYKESVYSFAYFRLRNFHDAEDVTQEVFIKAYQKLRTLRRWDNFLAWLYSITANLCRMRMRDRAKQPDREFIADQDPSMLDRHSLKSYNDGIAFQSLHDALDSLPETHRQVLTLQYLGGMKIGEIARFLGRSPSTIDRWLKAARSQLKKEMLAMVTRSLEQQRLPAGFTVRIMELVNRMRIDPLPRITGIPLGLSLAAGIMLMILNLGSHVYVRGPVDLPMNSATSAEAMPAEGETPQIREMPIDLVNQHQILPRSIHQWEVYSSRPGPPKSQNTLLLAPEGQEDYVFVLSFPAEALGLRSPWDVDIDKFGNIYVVDSPNHRIQKFAPNGEELAMWGTYGSDEGQFDFPASIAIDGSGNIYVAEIGNDRIQKFNANGDFILEWGAFGSEDGQFNHPVRVAVDSSGNVYVSDSRNNRIQKFDSEGNFLMKWGLSGMGDGQFNLPYGIAVDTSENVYVLDSLNYRIQKFDTNGTFLNKWGAKGDGNGQFSFSLGIAVDASGNIYVADKENSRIQKFDSNGNFLKKWGSIGYDNGQFIYPTSLELDTEGNIYVTDQWHSCVQKFDPDGDFLLKWGEPNADGQLDSPFDLALDNSGNIYVADYANQRIQKFDRAGNFLTKWGEYGTENGQFNWPQGIVADSRGNVYVADRKSIIQKFDSDGRFLKKWGSFGGGDGQFYDPTGIAVNGDGDIYVIDRGCRAQVFDQNGKFLMKLGSTGSGDGQFLWPEGIAVDNSGNIYVADSGNDRVQKFDSKGKFLVKWGSTGSEDGQFKYPTGMDVDSSGRVYVADTNNNRIQVFDSKGNFVAKFGSYGSGDMEFDWPHGIAVSRSGDVCVADTCNHRIKVFRSPVGGSVDPTKKQPVRWGQLKHTELYQNYPNPLNPETWIPYYLSEDTDVTISIHNTSGHLVRNLDLGHKPMGEYSGKDRAAYWDGRNETGEKVAPNVYFYTFIADGFTQTRKMIVLR